MIERALALIESVSDYRILFIGDAIIDEYVYVTPLGRSPKEILIPVRYDDHESFDGGTVAAAHHAHSFCKLVNVSTQGFVTRKRRFVERNYLRKLFEVHSTEGEYSDLQAVLFDLFDAVVITDFGHGAITRERAASLASSPQFIAVAAQTNSANVGYNLITKYPRADYIVIDEPEARLAAADRDSPIEDVIRRLAEGRCSKMIVTHGIHGSWGYQDGRIAHCPAFSERAIDTMGAGDAFFAVTAPMAKTGDIEDLMLIGNAAGSLKCQIVGHRAPVTKTALIQYLKEHRGPA